MLPSTPGGERRTLTVRALAIGVGVGALAAISNLYVSLRTGWTLPVMTTAALVGIAATRASRERLGAREATILTATASAAGYMAGGGNAAALPALAMMTGEHTPSIVAMAVAWIAIAILGTLVAPLLRSGTIDGAELAFPTATATAALARLGADGKPDEVSPRESRALAGTAIGAAAFSLLRNALGMPVAFYLPGRLGSLTLASLTFGLDSSLVLVGAGALMTLRTAISSLVGAVVTYAILVPMFLHAGVVPEASYRGAVGVMVWPSAALLVASALTTLLLGLPKLLRANDGSAPTKSVRGDRVRVAIMIVVASAVMTLLIGLPAFAIVLAVPIAFALAFVAARAMGETDIVPTKALTPLAQLVLGAAGADVVTTTLAPNMTSGVALHAADTLGSLKVAKATGTDPRLTIIARILGCLVGGVAVATAYALVVGDASSLPTNELPVPGVLVWRSVAVLSVRGFGSLPATTRIVTAIFGALGIAIAVAERILPERFVGWLPSPVGLGTGMVLPASNAVAMTLGAVGGRLLARGPRAAFAVPVASGLVAGESVVGIVWQAALALGLIGR